MNANGRTNWRFSIEDAANQAIDVSGSDAVRAVFALYGASGFDDLPECRYEQVFSELVRVGEAD